MIGINGIWWSFLISETVTVIVAILYLGRAEKQELMICNSRNIKDEKNLIEKYEKALKTVGILVLQCFFFVYKGKYNEFKWKPTCQTEYAMP